jgi:hypothetical protein
VSLGNYIVGAVLGVVALGAIAIGARSVRVALLGGATGPPAWVAEAVAAIALLVVALELAGVLSVFDRAGTVGACVLVGGAAAVAGRRLATATDLRDRVAPTPAAIATTSMVVAGAVVAAPWLAWTIHSYRYGMQTIDTLWYHLPQAARFVQLGSILHLQYFDRDPVTVFYPANAELLHAFGLLLFRSDVISPLINLGWAALALVAAWSIGRPAGRGPQCVIGVLIVLGTPGLVDTQPGGAYNDVACIALLLAAGAILVHDRSPRASALAAIAAGVALGTKFTMIVPTVALAAGMVAIAPSRARLRHAAIWAAGLVALGGYWYLRNAITAGNPLPSLAVHLGPLSLPAPHVTTPTYTIAQYITNGHIWRLIFIPGLRQSLGLAWWALIAGALAGAVGALARGPTAVHRVLGMVAILSGVAFIFTPQFLGIPGLPIFFNANVRYGASVLALGLVLAPTLPALAPARRGLAYLAVALAALLATELDPGVWPSGVGVTPFGKPISGGVAVAGAVLAALGAVVVLTVRRTAARAAFARTGAGLAAATIAVGGWFVADSYAHRKYVNTQPLPRIYAWARSVHHARIGVVGIDLQYPLYGVDDSNYVQYIGASEPHAGFRSIVSCRAWRVAVDRGHYEYVVVTPFGYPLGNAHTTTPEFGWTASDPNAQTLLTERSGQGEPAALYRLIGPLDPNGCAS